MQKPNAKKRMRARKDAFAIVVKSRATNDGADIRFPDGLVDDPSDPLRSVIDEYSLNEESLFLVNEFASLCHILINEVAIARNEPSEAVFEEVGQRLAWF